MILWPPLSRPADARATDLRVQRLRCEYQEAPLGIEAPRPRVSWQMMSKRRGERQTAYRVLVASDPSLLRVVSFFAYVVSSWSVRGGCVSPAFLKSALL